jgi:pimeloyl-ACP methyl ester carboxylesterase
MIQLAWRETGTGPAMVFQHGLCGDAGQPVEVFPLDGGWRCLTQECRGHGASEAGPPEHFSIQTFSADLISFIETRERTPVAIGGVSMGAAIAMRVAALRPDLVRGLVLGRPAWIAESAPPNLEANALAGDLLRRFPPGEARARFEESPIARTLAAEAPDNLASLRGFFSRQPIPVTAELLSRIASGGPGVTRRQIGSISVPALVVATARDFIHPLAMARELGALIPGARIVEITSKVEDAGRYRGEFRSALSEFLRGLA